MRVGPRGWGGIALVLLLMIFMARACVRIVPADAPLTKPVAAVPARPAPPAKSPPAHNPPIQAGRFVVPVEGVASSALVDTYMQSRAAGARRHDAIDIMAPHGRPVLAAVSGQVEKLFWSKDGGRTIYIRSANGRLQTYYAHLDSYAPGLREGQGVMAGQPIATVGSTGNADPAAPHLHFAVHVMRPGDPWYRGRAINPYPLLVPR
jgi:murein DD-endopeptidase MepM/ murein hydrolase activator NlpD